MTDGSRENGKNGEVPFFKESQMVKKEKSASIKLLPRPPVVTVMGHIDHGKTSLLDSIRQTNVVDQEFGGITQHIGAYQVEVALPGTPEKRKITFIDTPGHEAFTKMRARGASVTDIVVLVVAADDGVMPQTKEAIEHTRAANVPMIVAINKIDLKTARPKTVREQLVKAGVLLEDFGGDVPVVEVSAKEQKGIKDLLEMILLVAEMIDLKANFHGSFKGVVIESRLDVQKGPLATVLVKEGMLRTGDEVYVGAQKLKVKAMFDDQQRRVSKATPSTPVEVLGFSSVPPTGSVITGKKTTKVGKPLVKKRRAIKTRTVNLIIRADTEGTKEAVIDSLKNIPLKEAKVEVLLAGTGDVSKSDIFLAKASKAIVVGFNVGVLPTVVKLAETEGVEIKLYKLIYELLEDLEKGLKEMLTPKVTEELVGRGEIIAQFRGTEARIAGVKVTFGSLKLGEAVRLVRNGKVVGKAKIATMRHLKEDIKVAKKGQECGLTFDLPLDFKIKDVVECYRTGK